MDASLVSLFELLLNSHPLVAQAILRSSAVATSPAFTALAAAAAARALDEDIPTLLAAAASHAEALPTPVLVAVAARPSISSAAAANALAAASDEFFEAKDAAPLIAALLVPPLPHVETWREVVARVKMLRPKRVKKLLLESVIGDDDRVTPRRGGGVKRKLDDLFLEELSSCVASALDKGDLSGLKKRIRFSIREGCGPSHPLTSPGVSVDGALLLRALAAACAVADVDCIVACLLALSQGGGGLSDRYFCAILSLAISQSPAASCFD